MNAAIKLPADAKFASLSAVQAAASDAHQDALAEARREFRRGCLISRGKHLKIIKNFEVVKGEAESWPWDGNLASLVRAIDEAKELGADFVEIEGGLNYAESPRAYADCDYDPWVGEWSVVVWAKPEEDAK